MPRIKNSQATEPLLISAEEPEAKTMEVMHDTDNNTVAFVINGKEVELREPKGKDFLLMESWIRQSKDDYKDASIALIKLASLCVVKFGSKTSIDFESFFNELEELEDVERVAAAMDFFRDKIESYFRKLSSKVS